MTPPLRQNGWLILSFYNCEDKILSFLPSFVEDNGEEETFETLEDLSCYGVSFWRDQLTDRLVNQAIIDEYETYHIKAMDMQEVLLKAGYPKTMKACERDYDLYDDLPRIE